MKKGILVIRILSLFLSTALLVSLIYSWYIDVGIVKDASFNILQIDSLVIVYEANDINYNGVPNKIEESNKYFNSNIGTDGSYVEYKNTYYIEKYSFNFFDQKYALSQESEANTLNTINIVNAAPSRIFTYKYEITNYLPNDNDVEISILENSVSNIDNFSIRIGGVDENASIAFSDWIVLSNERKVLSDNLVVPKSTDSGRLDIWLQIKINDTSTTQVDKFTDYDSINKCLTLPTIKLKLTANSDSNA